MKQIIELLFLVLFFAVTKSKKISKRKSEMASEKRIKGRIQRFVSDPREPTLSEIWTKLENIGRIAGKVDRKVAPRPALDQGTLRSAKEIMRKT